MTKSEVTLDNVDEDQSVSLWMLAETRGSLDVIDNPKGAEVRVVWVVVLVACLPAAQAITHNNDGLGAAVGRLHGSLVMKHVLLQLLIWHTCCARWHWYPHICSVPFAHAALVAHMLGGLDDAAVGLCITQNFDPNEVKYVPLQLMLLTCCARWQVQLCSPHTALVATR